jgi:hypothetical protein
VNYMSSIDVVPEDNFIHLRSKPAIQQEPTKTTTKERLIKKIKRPAPRIMVQAGVQTSPREE